ncbi:phage head closure protein [Paraburkholderia nemoris]|uniref:phage head closure protein n=1 Tax=Paraburkholderia nemoris TaxID=2793076 RepID=UPI0038BD92F3
MRAGKLRHRVTIQQRGPARDSAGQPSISWVDFDTVWADVRYLNGRQYLTSDAEANGATVSVRIRYRTDVTAVMRVLYGTAVFDILAVLPDEDGRDHVDLACNTGVSNG